MLAAKQVADLFTLSRLVLAGILVWLGIAEGPGGLSLACWLLMAAWTSDCIDGSLARRSRVRYRSWIGDHDLEIDMSVALGLLIYMLSAGFVEMWRGLLYLLVRI